MSQYIRTSIQCDRTVWEAFRDKVQSDPDNNFMHEILERLLQRYIEE